MNCNRRSIQRKRQEWIASLESAHQTMLELVERDRAKVARTLEELGTVAFGLTMRTPIIVHPTECQLSSWTKCADCASVSFSINMTPYVESLSLYLFSHADLQTAAGQGLNGPEEFVCWMQCASIAYSMGRKIRDLKRRGDACSSPSQLDSRNPRRAQGDLMMCTMRTLPGASTSRDCKKKKNLYTSSSQLRRPIPHKRIGKYKETKQMSLIYRSQALLSNAKHERALVERRKRSFQVCRASPTFVVLTKGLLGHCKPQERPPTVGTQPLWTSLVMPQVPAQYNA